MKYIAFYFQAHFMCVCDKTSIDHEIFLFAVAVLKSETKSRNSVWPTTIWNGGT
jgi:hypothetical protein